VVSCQLGGGIPLPSLDTKSLDPLRYRSFPPPRAGTTEVGQATCPYREPGKWITSTLLKVFICVKVTLHVLSRHWYYGILSEMQLRINIPPLTRVLLALLLAIFVTYQVTRARHPEFLALIPQLSLLYPWVYFTATFAEQNILTLLVTAATILYGGKYLERAWGTTEFGKFVLVVTVIPYIAAAIVYLLWFVIARTDAHS